MVGTAFWCTKEEAERDAAATGLPIVGLGPMTSIAPVERYVGEPVGAEGVTFMGEPNFQHSIEWYRDGISKHWKKICDLRAEVERLRIALGNTQALLDQANHHKAQRGETIDTLRADVETMRRKNNEYWHETEVLRAPLGEAEAGCMRLRAQLAERDELLRLIAEQPMLNGVHRARIKTLLSASAEPSAPVERDERADFEGAYCEYFNALPSVSTPITPEQLKKTRDGDHYGHGSLGKNLRWAGWQMRAALERKPS